MRSNLVVLTAQKAQKERRRITLRTVATETGLSRYAVYAIANDTISEYSKDSLNKLCTYFDCELGDLFITEDVPDA